MRGGEEGYYKIFKPKCGPLSAMHTFGGNSLGFAQDQGEVGTTDEFRLFKFTPVNAQPQITIHDINFKGVDVSAKAK